MADHARPRHRGTELPVLVAGRPVKPLALALMVATAVLAAINALGVGAFGRSPWAWALAATSSLVTGLLAAGWAARSQAAAEAGLLLGAGLWAGRACALLALDGPGQWQAYLSACWAVAAGGAWLLERAQPDHRPGGR